MDWIFAIAITKTLTVPTLKLTLQLLVAGLLRFTFPQTGNG